MLDRFSRPAYRSRTNSHASYSGLSFLRDIYMWYILLYTRGVPKVLPLMTSFSSLSHPNFLPRRGSVNSLNQWKSLEARSGLLCGLWSNTNSHLNSRNIASWHKNQSNSGVVFLPAAAQPILHKPSFPVLHELIFANFHDLSLIIFLTLRMLFAYLHQVDFFQDQYLCESWLLLEHYIFQRLSISCKAAQPATNNLYVRSRVPIMQLELFSRLWWF